MVFEHNQEYAANIGNLSEVRRPARNSTGSYFGFRC